MASKELTIVSTADEAINALRGRLVVKIEDPVEVQRQMMEAIFDADSADEILGTSQAVHGQDIVDRAFTLSGVRFLKSRFEQGLPVFAVMDATFLDDGSEAAVTSSAMRVAAVAAQLWKLDALPIDVVIRRSENQTANGYYVYWLEAA